MLEVEGLKVNCGRIEAVKGISLRVGEGELVCLIGSNGAGKTTTLRAISGILRAAEGKIRFAGREITGLDSADIVRLGLSQSPEGRRIFGRLTVEENLRLGAGLRRDTAGIKQELEWVYSLFPVLKERCRQSGGTLSGGEQQMLAIGRALMSNPQLLMLDEPSLGLAPLMVDRIFHVIEALKRRGRTILLVEQNARRALQVADRGYVMETGKVILEGTGSDLQHNPEVERAYLGG